MLLSFKSRSAAISPSKHFFFSSPVLFSVAMEFLRKFSRRLKEDTRAFSLTSAMLFGAYQNRPEIFFRRQSISCRPLILEIDPVHSAIILHPFCSARSASMVRSSGDLSSDVKGEKLLGFLAGEKSVVEHGMAFARRVVREARFGIKEF